MIEANNLLPDLSSSPERLILLVHDNYSNGSTEPFFDHEISLHDKLLQDTITDCLGMPRKEWPDFTFSFSPTYMVGGGVFDTNPERRLANTIRAVRNVAPNSIEEGKAQDADLKLRATERFLKKPIIVKQSVLEVKPLDVIPADVFAEHFLVYLDTQNDPTSQALKQIQQEYGDKLEPKVLLRLRKDLIFATKPKTIEQVYKNYVSKMHSAGESLLRFMMQY